jgi:glucose/arabinose dehydrogenase
MSLAHYLRLLGAIVFIATGLTGLPTRAEGVRAQTVATDLQNPWGLAFLPDGRFLVTERPGRLRVVGVDGKLEAPVTGLPAIAAGGQGGLLDVLLDSDFARNRMLYFCFSEPAPAGRANSTALARATLSVDDARLENVKVIFSQKPKVASWAHFGCRIVESREAGAGGQPDGKLFLTLGERFSRKEDAQKLDNHLGKIVRINKDGSVPQDNPFVGKAGALPEIWSYGHRNSQGAALAPDGTLGCMNMGRRAATKSICPSALPITAGPSLPMAKTTAAARLATD